MRSELTAIERQIAYAGRLDLGAGYPVGLAPDWVWGLEPSGRSHLIPGQLEEAALYAMGFSSSHASLFSTFTGSIALQRAMIAARNHQLEKFNRILVLTTDPCIDIIPAMAQEVSGASAVKVGIGVRAEFSDEDCSAVCAEIDARSCGSNGLIVVLTSPENPTGAFWSRSQLERITLKCASTNSVLVVDHCFLYAGLQSERQVCAIWDAADFEAPIIGVWDTGKIVHLGGSKVGFLVAKNPAIVRALEDALSVVQFGVADYISIWFSRILSDPRFPDLIRGLRRAVTQNQLLLKGWAHSREVPIHNARAGTFELVKLDLGSRGGFGTVPFSVFTSNNREGDSWHRVALARQVGVFTNFLDQLR